MQVTLFLLARALRRKRVYGGLCVNHLTLIGAALKRSKGRMIFTWLSVVVAFILFSILAAVRYGMLGQLSITSAERLDTFSRVSFRDPLPVNYYDKIITVPGVSAVIYLVGIQGYYRQPKNTVRVLFTNCRSVLRVFPEFKLPRAEIRAWLNDRRGVIVGPALADRMDWKVGETVPIRSQSLRTDGSNTWYFHLDGIYHDNLPSHYQYYFVGHYQYFNQGVAAAQDRNVVLQYIERIDDPRNATRISESIDDLFANASPQTLTQPQVKVILSQIREIGNITAMVVYVGIAVFFSLLLIVGNTHAQSVRERTPELAMLRALGFGRLRIAWLAFEEALVLIGSGGIVGLFVGWLVTRALYPMVGNFLSTFQMTWSAVAGGIALAIVFAILASLVPLQRIARLRVAEALRKG
jgi:putative ABC transport system permease protein